MKRLTRYTMTIGTIAGLALPGAAWAQQDLEVTMGVVPANASASSAASEIKLPINQSDTASTQGHDSSAFGLGTADMAREVKDDVGRDFGQGVSETARGLTPNLPPQSRRP